MKIRMIRLCVQTSVWVLVTAFCVASLTGCGAANNLSTPSIGSNTAAVLSGTVHGGPNPVIGATVTLYATSTVSSPSSSNAYGYGQAATVVGTGTTNSSGQFSITTTGTCSTSPMQQAYIVAAGGNTTPPGTTNSNSAALLMAAIGPCSSIVTSGSTETNIIINEPSTIAAAYALSQFMSVSGTTVSISAPANNNAYPSGSCTNNPTTSAVVSCKAAGLYHAFLNAEGLVNAVGTVASPPTGQVNATLPTNTSAIVPQLLINTLANSVEACINSSGSSSSACTALMANTEPSACNSSATLPTGTLAALQDLAQCPSEANAPTGTATPSTATTNLYNIAGSSGYYSPDLTAAPDDFTIAIYYSGSNGTSFVGGNGDTTGPWAVATDSNDNAYVTANTSSSAEQVFGYTSNGSQLWTPVSAPPAGSCQTGNSRCSVATDTLGNVWLINYSASSGLIQLNASTGAIVNTYALDTGAHGFQVYVDPGNNVWTASSALPTSGSTLEELPEGTTTLADVDVGGAIVGFPIKELVLDSYGNMWTASDSGANFGANLFISSNGSLTSPAFAYTAGTNPATLPDPDTSNSHVNAPMMDVFGNMWVADQNQIFEVTGPAGTDGGGYAGSLDSVYGSNSGGTGITFSGVNRYDFMDGDGKIDGASANGGTGDLTVFYPNAPCDSVCTADSDSSGYNAFLNPCYVATGTTCETNPSNTGQSGAVNTIRGVATDASGALWVAVEEGPNALQVLGIGAPTWPAQNYKPVVYLANASGSGRPY
jgi:hypothetical protein